MSSLTLESYLQEIVNAVRNLTWVVFVGIVAVCCVVLAGRMR